MSGCRECRVTRRHLRELTLAVQGFLVRLDNEMKGPSTVERGKRIAALANALDMTNQCARRFGFPKAPQPAPRKP